MPRSGGVYSLPAGSTIANGDTSDATDLNTPLSDLETDMNTARPVVAGGTGATTASAARTALGLAIGTDVQAEDATLTSIAALGTAADKYAYTTGVDTWAEGAITAAGRAILDDADASAQRTTLGLDTLLPIGQQTIWIPAGAMTPTTTNGATPVTEELATNDVMVSGLDFDAATDEKAQFTFQSPKASDVSEGLIFEFIWKDAATAGSGDVVWAAQALALRDSSAMDAAFGTAVTATDTFLTSGDLHESGETSAATPAGTWAKEDTLIIQVYRDADAGGDTYTQDARLIGVRVHYTVDAGNDS